MKFLLLGTILLTISCSNGKQYSDKSLIEIDLKATPLMKSIKLQDIATVEYITIANDSSFIPRTKQLGISRDMKYIIARGEGGEVLIIDHQGMPISKINHEGKGPNE